MFLFASKSYAIPTVASILLHGVVLYFVIGGWVEVEERKPVAVPNYVPAKLIQLEKSAPKAQPKPKPKTIDRAAQQRERDRQRRAAEQQRQRELAQKQKAEQEKKQREKQEQERIAREKAEADRKRQEQEIQQRREQELSDMMAQEDALLQSEEDAELANSYSDVIYSKVYQNWSYPPSTRKGMRCEVSVTIVPTGRVVNVTLKKSSGNAAFDRSAEQAVRKAEQFPELKDLPASVFEQYFRNIVLIFEPQDTRL